MIKRQIPIKASIEQGVFKKSLENHDACFLKLKKVNRSARSTSGIHTGLHFFKKLVSPQKIYGVKTFKINLPIGSSFSHMV